MAARWQRVNATEWNLERQWKAKWKIGWGLTTRD
jgi:hypothetical protein